MANRGYQSHARVDADVKFWNEEHAIGTPVIVTRDNGEELRTKTRSAAWVLSGHSAVIMVDGISGCYALERVRPVRPVGALK